MEWSVRFRVCLLRKGDARRAVRGPLRPFSREGREAWRAPPGLGPGGPVLGLVLGALGEAR
eukprot:13388899-Alexandrium_andersonii.AAC.1